jgi:ectoine hydroxylase-related dioxygenase (phytanoyl-CoA dioxygenase family)
MAKIVPVVEIVAPRGSVVFWHHRLAHAAGIKRSQQIRHAVLADYPPSNYESDR